MTVNRTEGQVRVTAIRLRDNGDTKCGVLVGDFEHHACVTELSAENWQFSPAFP